MIRIPRDFVVGLGYGACVGILGYCVRVGFSALQAPKVSDGSRRTSTKTHQVSDIEDRFFQHMDRAANLTNDEIEEIKTSLKTYRLDERIHECKTLRQILHVLCDHMHAPDRYRELCVYILMNFPKCVQRLRETLTRKIEQLKYAVSDIKEIQTHRVYELDQFELDVFILHTEDDKLAAATFTEHIITDGGIRGLSVLTYTEFCDHKAFNKALGDIFMRTRYIFVFMTKTMITSYTDLITNIGMADGLEDTTKSRRIKSVRNSRDELKIPEKMEESLEKMEGSVIKYWQFMENGGEKQNYLTNLNEILVEGRKRIIRPTTCNKRAC